MVEAWIRYLLNAPVFSLAKKAQVRVKEGRMCYMYEWSQDGLKGAS